MGAFLPGRPAVGQDLRVAGIGRLVAEDARSPDRLAEDLVQHRQLELAVSLTAEFGAEVARPQTVRPHLGLQRVDDRALLRGEVRGRLVVVVRPQGIDLVDLVGDEAIRPVQEFGEFRFGGEIPCHYEWLLSDGEPRAGGTTRYGMPPSTRMIEAAV